MTEPTLKSYCHNEKSSEIFYSIFIKAAKSFGCNYIGYVYEDVLKGIRTGFITNPDWQKQYLGQGVIEKCHLWNAVKEHFINTNVQNYILRWEDIIAKNAYQKDIALYRQEMGIGNGVSFCTRLGNVREYLAFFPRGK